MPTPASPESIYQKWDAAGGRTRFRCTIDARRGEGSFGHAFGGVGRKLRCELLRLEIEIDLEIAVVAIVAVGEAAARVPLETRHHHRSAWIGPAALAALQAGGPRVGAGAVTAAPDADTVHLQHLVPEGAFGA